MLCADVQMQWKSTKTGLFISLWTEFTIWVNRRVKENFWKTGGSIALYFITIQLGWAEGLQSTAACGFITRDLKEHVEHKAPVCIFPYRIQANQFNKQRLGKSTYPSRPCECSWAPPAAARRPVWLLRLDERFLLSITTVSSTEWLPLITANIISHEEFQSPPEHRRRQKHIKWGLSRALEGWQLAHERNCVAFHRELFRCETA